MSTVEYEVHDGVAQIFLNRPRSLNAVVPELVDDLLGALDRAQSDAVGAVVLAGRGRAFCAGHDLRHEADPEETSQARARLERVQDVTRKIRDAPHPVIAAVHGYALGAGCEFALCADLIIASQDATFGFPEVGVGLSVTGGISHVLPVAVGLAKAKELILLGEFFEAAEAQRLGLVNFVVSPDELAERAMALAATLRDRPRTALSHAKQALDRGVESGIDVAYQTEIDHAMSLMGSPDAATARSSFQRRGSDEIKGAR